MVRLPLASSSSTLARGGTAISAPGGSLSFCLRVMRASGSAERSRRPTPVSSDVSLPSSRSLATVHTISCAWAKGVTQAASNSSAAANCRAVVKNWCRDVGVMAAIVNRVLTIGRVVHNNQKLAPRQLPKSAKPTLSFPRKRESITHRHLRRVYRFSPLRE